MGVVNRLRPHETTVNIESIVKAASHAVGDVTSHKLEVNLWRGGITCAVSLLGAIGIAVFIANGPELEAPASLFVGLLLFTCIALFIVGLLSTITTVLSMYVYHRARLVHVEMESYELQEELEITSQQLSKTVRILMEAKNAPEPSVVLREYDDEIAELCNTRG